MILDAFNRMVQDVETEVVFVTDNENHSGTNGQFIGKIIGLDVDTVYIENKMGNIHINFDDIIFLEDPVDNSS